MSYYTSSEFASYDLYKIYYGITQQMGASGLATEATLQQVRNALIYNYGLPGQKTTAELIQSYYQNLDSPLSGLLTVLNNISTYTAGTQTSLSTTNPNLVTAPQDISGNTDVYASDLTRTASGIVYTVTASKTLYVHALTFSGSGTNPVLRFRDGNGGTIKSGGRLTSTAQNFCYTFQKPLKFTSSVYVELAGGTLTALDTYITGYEK